MRKKWKNIPRKGRQRHLRHLWGSKRVYVTDWDQYFPCECRWWKRLWYLVTGR